MNIVQKAIARPWLILPMIIAKTIGPSMDDEKYIKLIYRLRNKKSLNLENPVTFFEKINYLKLHDRRDIYTTMVDKYAVKKYVGDIIGEEYIIPLLGVWDSTDDIEYDKLPDSFVLKCSHDGGSTIICKDKSRFDKAAAKKLLDKHLKTNLFYLSREWPYKNVKPRIICEEYIPGIVDKNYKLFCFNGEVKFLYVAPYRETTADYYDADFNHIDGLRNRLHSGAENPPKKPETYEKMKELASKISAGYPHMRIDFYDDNGRIYFGEITFYQEAGMVPWIPDEWNYKFGEYLDVRDII